MDTAKKSFVCRWPLTVTLVLLVGLVTTVSLALAAAATHRSNERRLLKQRVGAAALELTTAVPSLQTPLVSGAVLAQATHGDPTSFRELMQPLVGPKLEFTSASLWMVGQKSLRPAVVVGSQPVLLKETSARIKTFLARADTARTLAVEGLVKADPPSLGYSFTSTSGAVRYIVYAETTLPKHRTAVVQSNSLFAGVDYAVYFGTADRSDRLLAANTSHLPLTGDHAAEDIAFGTGTLRIDMKPTSQLGGRLLAWLPWAIGGIGVLLSLGFAALTARLLRRQTDAERLAGENADLYANQRTVAQTLQLSLLPKSLPSNESVEFGVRYEAGVDGIDIGGDWYDVIPIDDDRILAVMGDVSGRGLGAATVMASLRYAIRAFASQGHDPATILSKLDRIVDLERDGHFATVLLAEANLADRTITIASAGHPQPLLIDEHGSRFIETNTSVPVGVPGPALAATTHTVPPQATVLLFTDGLFERRGEVIDAGLDRLRVAAGADGLPLEALLTKIVKDLTTGGAHDDTALLGMRWLN